MFNVNFEGPETEVICHSQYDSVVPKILEGLKPLNLKNHFVLFSSGTTGGDLKGYAISKEALFNNARAVNEFFGLTQTDVSGLSLPVYHIGGLSVLARAHLLNYRVVDARNWEPNSWLKKTKDVTITTIVPTQLFDLVKMKAKPSPALRYLIVGGDLLSKGLKDEAMKLGWPVIRTFGMSEVCSQLASAKNPQSDELQILPIHHAKTDVDGRLLVKSSALFTLQFTLGSELKIQMAKDLCDTDGFYKTSDKAEVLNGTIKHLGRLGDEFKISGHLVNLLQLKNTLGTYLLERDLYGQMEFQIEEDERKGKKLVLLSLPEKNSPYILNEIAKLIHPVKIDEIRILQSFDRTSLGKLKKTQA
ncbi:AMP-binding protein [Peredibacter starrii]|uniref:AMP-binding protein n=1 Tax=Peredibacter starrii TaxID=28202 RepID=A0AAX4HKI9_9BACT|nr:AMP-binding protein [Peredibacter starrii]WPU63763.1 AMP-binding protein [Peredibacter starrii]